MMRKFLSSLLMAALVVAFVFPQGANAQVDEEVPVDEDTVKVLSAIENMPDKIIFAGQEERQQWIEDYTGLNIQTAPSETPTYSIQASWSQVATCAGAAGTAAVVSLTPAKVFKVKAALKAAGGAKKFVTKFASAYKTFKNVEGKPFTTAVNQAVARAAKEAGPDARVALASLFGLSTVAGACGWIFE